MTSFDFVLGVVSGGLAAFGGFVSSSFLFGLWVRFRGRGGKVGVKKVKKVRGPEFFFEFNQNQVKKVKKEKRIEEVKK